MLFSTQLDQIAPALGKDGKLKGIELLAEAGFPAIDLTLYQDIEYAIADDWKNTAKLFKDTAASHGVVFNQAHAPICDAERYKNVMIPLLPKIFEFSAAIGAEQIVVHPIQMIPYEGNEEKLFEINMELFRSLAPHAKACGIKIGLENMWQPRALTGVPVDDVCADPREMIRYYEELNDPDAFTCCLDIGHIDICGRDPADVIRTIGHDRLGAIHVHDVDHMHDLHTIPGCGKLNWDSICRALADIKYQGEFTLEADCFLAQYEHPLRPAAATFMAEVAKHLVNKIESYMAE